MPASPQRFRLTRSMRLQRSGEFAETRRLGRRLARGCVILNWRPRPDLPHSRLGVVTSRRVGSAVVRSRARRLLREAFRQLQPQIQPPSDVVLVARTSIKEQDGRDVRRQVETALRHARLLPKSS
jgi:ribonuclease P protein component